MSDQPRISRAAQKAKPKRPLNAYFAFRVDFLKGLSADETHKNERATLAFADLSQKEKDKLEADAAKRLDKWRDQMTDWKKQYGIKDAKSKSKSKSKSKTKEEGKSKPKKK